MLLSKQATQVLDWILRLRKQAMDDNAYVQQVVCSTDDLSYIIGAVMDTRFLKRLAPAKFEIDGLLFRFSDVLPTGRNLVVLMNREKL